MKKLIVQEKVFTEVEGAWLYYEKIITGLGDQFLEDWENILLYVEKHPEHFQKRKKDFRCASLKRFPYMVCFVIEPKFILVYKLIHIRKKPSKRYRQ